MPGNRYSAISGEIDATLFVGTGKFKKVKK